MTPPICRENAQNGPKKGLKSREISADTPHEYSRDKYGQGLLRPKTMQKSIKPGFTLVEVLIALGIIAAIAAFTIPKVMTSSGTTHEYATYKEIFNVLYTLLDQGMVTGDLETDGSNFGTYFMAKIKAVKKCRSNSQIQGCWSAPNYPGQTNQPGMILSNGAYVVGFDNGNAGFNTIIMDWNGDSGPNEVGSDRLFLGVCYRANGCSGNDYGTATDPGSIGPATLPALYTAATIDAARANFNRNLFNSISNVQ